MKKIILLLLVFTGVANAQVINFPDPNLKAALIAPTSAENLAGTPITTVDANSDGDIQVSEALNVGRLNISAANISNLTGIEQFVNLKRLQCNNNQIATCNATAMTALEELVINNNQLTLLNASGLPLLTGINYAFNPNLSHLDLSDCPNLGGTVSIQNNALAYLDVSNSGVSLIDLTSGGLGTLEFDGCPNLSGIMVWNSALTAIDVHDLPSLTDLSFFNNTALASITVANCPLMDYFFSASNNISTLDVSGMPSLTMLYCPDNQLTALDVSSLVQLNDLVLDGNPLQSLFMKNGSNEGNVSLAGNTNLAYVCVDESQIAAIQGVLNAEGLASAVCNSYCTFTPGGAYNTITGTVRFDADGNGCDPGDANPMYMRVDISDGTNTNTAFANTNGAYKRYTQAGSFTITPSAENAAYFAFSPPTDTAIFPNNLFNVAVRNFCGTAVGIHPDLEVVIAPVIPARPGFNAVYNIVYRNKGNQVLSQPNGVTFAYNPSQLDFVSSSVPVSSASPGNFSWDYANLRPFESRSILVTLYVHGSADPNPVNVNDLLSFASAVLPAVDEQSADNNFPFDQTAVAAYDPNEITCIQGDVVSTAQIGDYLHYVINFENTGTVPGQNIVIRMPINTAQFDLASLQLLHASHTVEASVTGNIAEFIFQGINLGIGGHGHILLKIRTNDNLVGGNTVSGRADIFYDYNFPVDTGNANTTFSLLFTPDYVSDPSVIVYPNPVVGILTIRAGSNISKVEVFDVFGRLLSTHLNDTNRLDIDLTDHPEGIYIIKAYTQDGIMSAKILRE